ncbi:tyrosine--tRNA ligase [Patescibacteria group bacterium]|nr:tyrosine--tRNA ligase [Patescibacteria group bacterium]
MKKHFQLEEFKKNIETVYTEEEWLKRISGKTKLRVKYGVDVTSPFLHLGHAVNLWKMRELQEMGHKIIFLIGDFTTTIGDPTGRAGARPELSQKDILKNTKEFIRQVKKILLTKPSVFEIQKNSQWYGNMKLKDFLGLLRMVTHSRLIERDMFQERICAHREIYMHELIYPILQGYDSVMLKSDLTIIGSDQLFNEMMGRFFQEKFGQSPQVIMTTRITPGIDGKEKMSKSLGNYIALDDSPRDKFGKAMSIPDELIVPYFEAYTAVADAAIQKIKSGLALKKENPRDAKMLLAEKITERYHGARVAAKEREYFQKIFSEKEIDIQNLPVKKMPHQSYAPVDLVSMFGFSRSEARRLILGGAVEIDGKTYRDAHASVAVSAGTTVKIGKKILMKIV